MSVFRFPFSTQRNIFTFEPERKLFRKYHWKQFDKKQQIEYTIANKASSLFTLKKTLLLLKFKNKILSLLPKSISASICECVLLSIYCLLVCLWIYMLILSLLSFFFVQVHFRISLNWMLKKENQVISFSFYQLIIQIEDI